MEALIAYAHGVPSRVRRQLRFDWYAQIRPVSWKPCWSYEVERGERGAWDVDVWAGRLYLSFGRMPRRDTSEYPGTHG